MEEKFERRNEDNGVGKIEKSGACDSILGSTYKQIRRKNSRSLNYFLNIWRPHNLLTEAYSNNWRTASFVNSTVRHQTNFHVMHGPR